MSIYILTILCILCIFINQTTSLVELADISYILILLSVALSSFIDKYKNGNISYVDGITSGGFLTVLFITIQKHFLN